jgi:hypothetical protein
MHLDVAGGARRARPARVRAGPFEYTSPSGHVDIAAAADLSRRSTGQARVRGSALPLLGSKICRDLGCFRDKPPNSASQASPEPRGYVFTEKARAVHRFEPLFTVLRRIHGQPRASAMTTSGRE